MEFEKLLQDLNLSEEIVIEMLRRKELARQHEEIAMAMTVPETNASGYEALAAMLGEDDLNMLACQLWIAAKTRSLWAQQGIDDQVFLATMGCYRRFMGETLKRTGKLSFDRGWWSYRQLSRVLFRIGELEYEIKEKEISVHIPSDSCLTSGNVDTSIAAAREFFARFYPACAQLPMTCDSWLLSPELAKLLPEDSRILGFQKRFRITETNPDAMDCLEWLFRVGKNTPLEQLPEETSLQRSVKQVLLSGGKIGIAYGTLI